MRHAKGLYWVGISWIEEKCKNLKYTEEEEEEEEEEEGFMGLVSGSELRSLEWVLGLGGGECKSHCPFTG